MKRIHIQLLFLVPAFFGYSYALVSPYLYGDQSHYRALYAALASVEFSQVLPTSKIYINANDPLSAYILWIGAHLSINKDIYISSINAFMLSALYMLAAAYRIRYTMIALLLCNFYVVVLMTGAERLKFAVIFLIVAALTFKKFTKAACLLLAVFAHLESILFVTSALVWSYHGKVIDAFRANEVQVKALGLLFVFVIVVIAVASFKWNGIILKYEAYEAYGGILQSLSAVLFMIVSLTFVKGKIGYVLALLPLLLATLFIGAERVNMIIVFIGVYIFWLEEQGNHPFLYVLMIYFAIKSVPLVLNIMKYGNGFPTIG